MRGTGLRELFHPEVGASSFLPEASEEDAGESDGACAAVWLVASEVAGCVGGEDPWRQGLLCAVWRPDWCSRVVGFGAC